MEQDMMIRPTAFAPALGTNRPRPYTQLAEGLWLSKVYWTNGPAPKGAVQSAVLSPPVSGWSQVFVVGPHGDKDDVWVLCPYSLRSFRLPPGCHERGSLQGVLDTKDTVERRAYFQRLLSEKAAAFEHREEQQVDWDAVDYVLKRLGGRIDVAYVRPAPTRTSVVRSEKSAKPVREPKPKPEKPVGEQRRSGATTAIREAAEAAWCLAGSPTDPAVLADLIKQVQPGLVEAGMHQTTCRIQLRKWAAEKSA